MNMTGLKYLKISDFFDQKPCSFSVSSGNTVKPSSINSNQQKGREPENLQNYGMERL